jgi:hypothetical protein
MPNEVTYVDEHTVVKAVEALYGKGALDISDVLAAIDRLRAVGIVFRELVEPRTRGPRMKTEPKVDAKEKRPLRKTESPKQLENNE